MQKGRQATRRWFNRWSNDYDQTLGSIGFHRGVLDLVVNYSNVRDGDRVLDIGCGTGLLSVQFLRAADCSVTGIDTAREMLALFRNKIGALDLRGRARVMEMDAGSIRFQDSTFDIAASSFVLHHLKEKGRALRRVWRALKPGGRFIIGEIDMDSTGRHADAARLRRMLEALEEEWVHALKDVGVQAFAKMYDNGKKHILNQGEHCVSLSTWAALCRKAGFERVTVKRLSGYRHFGIVVAKKPAGQ